MYVSMYGGSISDLGQDSWGVCMGAACQTWDRTAGQLGRNCVPPSSHMTMESPSIAHANSRSVFTLRVVPHMWLTSNSEPPFRQWVVESMIESLYWIGMDHPANGTILPIRFMDLVVRIPLT